MTERRMGPERIAAFTDGVIAIIITIMVLELKVPESGDLRALAGSAPILLAYALSFVNVGLYWNNHHHMFSVVERIDGRVLWANLFLLFWLSLVPFVIRWLDETQFAAGATAAYGIVLGLAAIGYSLTERAIIACNGKQSAVARAIGSDWKGWGSIALYAIAVPLAFASRWAAIALYCAVIGLWLIPDRRIIRAFNLQGQI
ncbi:putative membrane protein [Sphingomonas sp. PP-F2F-G114-C0414]|uniref:TMEM175 family protein n=1 Tax=Sphingomonas sp. PP-F2F-G114-C0414 TaxID=2135662 RepID=UPI000F0D3B6E|nr:TMEM175 family protein [Sphingomonas sp. PP-F2F-G114-C0414]RMB35692.1 putative membrane protein [Sphingomonas sp. PP-F2F-G114-C0414]